MGHKRVALPLTDEGLTLQEAWFVDEYLIDFSQKYAAIRIGIPADDAANWAAYHLRKSVVRGAIEKRVAEKRKSAARVRDEVFNELHALSTSRHQDYDVDVHGRLTLNDVPLERGDRAHAAIKRVKRRTYFERDPDGDGPDALRAVHEVEFELWDKNAALRNLGQHLGMFIERSAVATDPEHPDGNQTVWDFGGKKITF